MGQTTAQRREQEEKRARPHCSRQVPQPKSGHGRRQPFGGEQMAQRLAHRRGRSAGGPAGQWAAARSVAGATGRLEARVAGMSKAHGYATELWTLERIRRLIHDRFGVWYDPAHAWRLLGRMG